MFTTDRRRLRLAIAAILFAAAAWVAVGVFREAGGKVAWNLHRPHPAGWTVWDFVLAMVLVTGLVCFALARRLAARRSETTGPVLSRRAFLAGSVAAGAGLATVAYGDQVGRYELGLTTRQLAVRDLPVELSGLRVVMMADLHCGPHNSMDYLRRAVALCNEARPDLILIPGDLISYNLSNASKAAELLAQLQTGIKDGLFVSWGNHDHWHGLADDPELLNGTGATLLGTGKLDRLQLTRQRNWETSPTGSGLWIAGVDDLWTANPDVARALHGIPDDQPRLLLCHNPDVAEEQTVGRVDLMLSGHTHGGQVRIPGLGAPIVPSHYGQKYAQGLVQAPGYPVYVTRGVGVGGIPIRLGVPPEVTLFELTRA